MRALTAAQLRGVWAAIPTPWTAHHQLDAATLEKNVLRYMDSGISGIYTTDSDGEFYAVELPQFKVLARRFGRAVEKSGLDAAMGVTWSHTGGIIDRIKASLDAGIPNVHVGFPYWMPLAKPDIPRFFADLANQVPLARWIHYRTERCHILPSGSDYARIRSAHPDQFIGTKLGTNDFLEIAEIIASVPNISHFTTDYSFVPGALAGSSGFYSFWVNTLPGWTVAAWRLCEAGDWTTAIERQKKLIRWEVNHVNTLAASGHDHGVLAKARGALTQFLADNGNTMPPYYPIGTAAMRKLAEEFAVFWGDEAAKHRPPRDRKRGR